MKLDGRDQQCRQRKERRKYDEEAGSGEPVDLWV
jgi:hypothetical protein